MNHSPFPTPNPDRYTEEEISQLVHTFYAKARKDPSLGPIFEAHVIDWDAHFVQMTNFWSAQLRGTSRFRGAPMPKHIHCPNSRQNCSSVGCSFSNKQRKNSEILICNNTLMQWRHSLPRDYGKDIK